MSARGGRGGGGRRGGGRRGGGDFGRGGGRGREGGERNAAAAPPRQDPPAPAPRREGASSSSSTACPSPQSVTGGVGRLTIRDEKPEEMAVAATTGPVTPAPSSSKAVRPPRRPGYGTVGMRCVVRANHFLVEVAHRDLTHYDVDISPKVISKQLSRDIVAELVRSFKESHLGGLTPAYDGGKSLYTARPFPFSSKQFKIKLTYNDREKEYDVSIKEAGQADLVHLQQFLQGRNFDSPQDTIQALDVVLREVPSQKYVRVSRSFFSTQFGNKNIGDGLECWRGYYQSLRPTQMGLSLNIDISATSFYKPVPVIEFALEYLNIQEPMRPLTEKQRVGLKKVLRGVRVEVTHRKDIRRRYKITGLTNVPLSQLTFEIDDKRNRVSVVQYFQDTYQCSLRKGHWPCLQAGSDSKPAYLPMEVCDIVEGQRFSKKLNERQVTEILRATCQRPEQRERSIMEMVHHNDYRHDKYANEFGIKVDGQLTSVEARVIPPPTLMYHNTGKEKTCNPRVGAWNMIGKKMVNGGTVQSWACVSFSRTHQDAVYNFCQQLFDVCNNIGMVINPKPVVGVRFERPENVERALRNLHAQASAALKGNKLQLLLIVLPEIKGSYGMIKTVCETQLGLVSQCCLPKHVQACKIQYMENVALKINVKVGGRNCVLADAINKRIPLVTDKATIIFGADVTHPPPGEDSSSIAAVVASMDWPQVTLYRGLVSAQAHRKEIISDLFTTTHDPKKGVVYGGMIRELLIGFRRATKQRPERIIFYRDGVSEGQFSQVLLEEMDAIRKACQSLETDYLPPVTFIVVQKRHHTRLFPEVHRSNKTDRSGNILPGTVVDLQICHPTEFDFYLCSHSGIQGTSRPTHYHVLYDENNFTADGLQVLTNNLCYTYARCTRSVSVVPPAYYAHLAAFRARYYAEAESEVGSPSAGGTRRSQTDVRPLPQIMENVKEVMFYC